jgi:hypothetical protein
MWPALWISASFSQHRGNRLIDGVLVGDVHVDRPQRNVMFIGVPPSVGRRLLVPPGDVPHACVDNVFRVGERANRERAEAAGRAGDENDLRFGHQMTPPLT